MATYTTERYTHNASAAIGDRTLQKALSGFQHRLGPATAATYKALPEGPGLRDRAHAIRMQAIDNLDILLETLAENVRKNGGNVFFASTAEAAVAYCLELARRHRVKCVVKGKSMVTEEVGLNDALEREGIEVNETDLGEYIIQLAGEKPSHIIAPAIHKTREQVGRLFAEKLGIAYTDDPPTLTQSARRALREKFLQADMGITGCNLACAETGHITTVFQRGEYPHVQHPTPRARGLYGHGTRCGPPGRSRYSLSPAFPGSGSPETGRLCKLCGRPRQRRFPRRPPGVSPDRGRQRTQPHPGRS